MHDLTAFQRDQIYVIASRDEPRGVAVKRELEEYYAEEITSSRLYPNLNDLVEKGLVNKEPINDRANAYTLSRRGRRELEVRQQWERSHVGGSGDAHASEEDVESAV